MLGKFHGDVGFGKRKRVRDHAGHQQGDVDSQASGHGSGFREGRGGFREVSEDDLKIQLAAVLRYIGRPLLGAVF